MRDSIDSGYARLQRSVAVLMDRPDVLRKICKLRVTTPMDVIYLNLAGFEGQDASQFLSTLMVPFHTVISHTPALEELYLAHTVLNTDLATAVLSAHHLHTITLSSCIVEEPLELQICTTVLNANFYHMGEKTLNPGLSFRRSPTYVIYAWPLTREPTSPSLQDEILHRRTLQRGQESTDFLLIDTNLRFEFEMRELQSFAVRSFGLSDPFRQ